MDAAFAAAPVSGSRVAAQTKLHLPSSTSTLRPTREHRSRWSEVLVAGGASLGLHEFRLRRSRIQRLPRAGAPPKSIWQTKRRLAVERLERQWLMSEQQVEAPVESKEDFPQAVLRFLGGSVLMAVLAQASFRGRKAGSEVPPLST